MIRTYKYKLKPNKTQTNLLGTLLWQSRNLYNAALEQRINVYKETQKSVSYYSQCKTFKDEIKNSSYFSLLNSASAQQTLRRLDKAFKAFFRRIKNGETPGFPRFKNHKRFKSVEYVYGNGCKLTENNKLYIQHIGEIKMFYHRPIPDNAKIKHVVIKRYNDKWYVCFMIELLDVIRERKDNKHVGIDVGLKTFLATSDNQLIDNKHFLKENLRKLRIAQRTVSRRKKGSNRYYKAVHTVARIHEKIANKRLDYLHKVSRAFADNYSLIAIEDLNYAFMNKNRHLSQASYDVGFGLFEQLLTYKVEETGGQLIKVNPAYTSQVCSKCGVIVSKKLTVRTHKCPDCGLVLDRDINAARNILQRAYITLGLSVQDITWENAPCVSCQTS